jgi:hypothetical protein
VYDPFPWYDDDSDHTTGFHEGTFHPTGWYLATDDFPTDALPPAGEHEEDPFWALCTYYENYSDIPCRDDAGQSGLAAKSFSLTGFKQALVRPVFPSATAQYSEAAADFGVSTPDASGVGASCFQRSPSETGPAGLTTDHYESLVILPGTTDADAIRALGAWAENSAGYTDYFIAEYAGVIGDLMSLAESADSTFDRTISLGPYPGDSESQVRFRFDTFGQWWSANGKISVSQADTPAGSLVAAVSINGAHRYVWRKTDTTGRAVEIVTNGPYDSAVNRFSPMVYPSATSFPRKSIRSASDTPPGSFDETF